MDYKSKIREFIVDKFLFGDDSSLQDDTSFLESGIIDSTGILEVITYIETETSIKIADEELLPENLDSLDKIDAFLTRKVTT
ncbi:MAG: acyl carrier protein [Chitinivibrionales bacterium]|nr:acyl carrier protein [Chitinivibrionales bacterium]